MRHTHNGFTYIQNKIEDSEKNLFEILTDKFTSTPTELYHYYRINSNSVESLVSSYIYANHPRNFNDPFDCNVELISMEKSSLEDILDFNRGFIESKDGFYNEEELKRLYHSNDENDKIKLDYCIKNLLALVIYLKLGVFSMTDVKNSMSMWTYYNDHKGFVLKYNIDKLNFKFWGPFPINYTNDFSRIDYDKFKIGSFIYQSNIKAECWKHENEWRLLVYGPSVMKIPGFNDPKAHNRKFFHNPDAVSEIIFGIDFFDRIEYIDISEKEKTVRLRIQSKLKRKILNYTIEKNLKSYIIKQKWDSNSILGADPIEFVKVKRNKYKIKYVG